MLGTLKPKPPWMPSSWKIFNTHFREKKLNVNKYINNSKNWKKNCRYVSHDRFSHQWIVNMAGSIKLFQFVQDFFPMIGIYPAQQNQNKNAFNSTNAFFFIVSIELILSTIAFLVFDAKTIFACGFGFYVLPSVTVGMVIYSLMIWKFENMLELIGNCEEFIEKSEFTSYFSTFNKASSTQTWLEKSKNVM